MELDPASISTRVLMKASESTVAVSPLVIILLLFLFVSLQ
jgi:hypothetical protein